MTTARRARSIILAGLVAASALAVLFSFCQCWRFRVPLAVLAGAWYRAGILAAALSLLLFACAGVVLARAWAKGEAPCSSVAIRAFFAVTVLGGAGFLVAVPEFEAPWVELYGSACLGLWAGFLLIESRVARVAPGVLRAVDLVLFDLALVLVLFEGSLRILARWRPSPLLATSGLGAEQVLEHFRQPPGMARWGFPTNSHGHFDEEFTAKEPGERLVACIGDSFSFSAVPHYWHYTTICERLLAGTRVDNFGVPGVGPPEYEVLLRTEALPLRPDLVVIAIFVGNDVMFSGAGDDLGGGILESWLGRRTNLTWTAIHRWTRLRADARTGGAGDRDSNVESGEAARTTEDPTELERKHPWLHDPSREPAGLSEPAFRSIEQQRVRELCIRGPDLYAPFFRAMEGILRTAGGTPIGVLLLPDQFQVDEDLWEVVSKEVGAPDDARDRVQHVIGAWLDTRGVPFVDMLPRFREAPVSADGSRHLYVLRNTHFNVAGNEIAARCLAELVRKMSG